MYKVLFIIFKER